MKSRLIWDNGTDDPPMRVFLHQVGTSKFLRAEFQGEDGQWRPGSANPTNDPSSFEILEAAFLEHHEQLLQIRMEEMTPMFMAFEALESYSENQLVVLAGRTIIFRGLLLARRVGIGLEIIAEGPQRDGALEVEALWRRYPQASVLNPSDPSR